MDVALIRRVRPHLPVEILVYTRQFDFTVDFLVLVPLQIRRDGPLVLIAHYVLSELRILVKDILIALFEVALVPLYV